MQKRYLRGVEAEIKDGYSSRDGRITVDCYTAELLGFKWSVEVCYPQLSIQPATEILDG
jgi:hypothetical protein